MLTNRDRISTCIANIISLFDRFEQLIKLSDICTCQFKEFSTLILDRKSALTKFEEERQETLLEQSQGIKEVNQEIIENALQIIFTETFNLLLLIQLCNREFWPQLSLSIDVLDLFEELRRYQLHLYEQFVRLNLESGNEYGNSKKAIEDDLLQLKSFYEQTQKKDDPLVQRQLAQINKLYQQHNIEPSTELLEVDTDPILQAVDWHFDISKLAPNGQLLLSNADYAISEINDKDDPSSSYLVLDILNRRALQERNINKERRLMMLFAIHSNSILPLVGGYVQNDIYKAVFKNESDLLLKNVVDNESHVLNNPATLTKIAFYTAVGMNHLYENTILHGNLSLSSVLIKQTGKLVEPLLFGFGFSIPNRLAFEPPEFFSDGIYTLKSDIYQYGLFLWELGRQETVYDGIRPNQLPGIILDESKRPPLDDAHFSSSMQKLISECLSSDPELRPLFSEIIQRFKCGHIYFGDAQEEAMEFAQSIRAQQFKSILDLVNDKKQHGQGALVDFLTNFGFNSVNQNNRKQLTSFVIEKSSELVNFVNETNRKETPINRINLFHNLIDMEIFNILTPEIFSTKNKDEIVDMYVALSTPFDNNSPQCVEFALKFINNFMNSGGTELIDTTLLTNSVDTELALQLLSGILFALPINQRVALLPSTILSKQYSYTRRLISSYNEPSFSNVIDAHMPILSAFLPEINYSDDIAALIRYYIGISHDKQALEGISATDVIKSGLLDLLKELMKYQTFLSKIRMDDCVAIAETLISKTATNEQKNCALFLSLGLGSEIFKFYANYSNLIETVLNYSNQELASRFIARVAQFPAAAEYLSRKNDFFMDNINNGWYLVALSRIAGFYPNIVVTFSNLHDQLLRNLTERIQIEMTIRLLGTLSLIKGFWKKGKLVAAICNLLESKTLTQLETLLSLSLLSNISTFADLSRHYLTFVALAEIGNEISGLALRILGRIKLPSNSTSISNRALRRLIMLCKARIQDGDEFSCQECARILAKLLNSNNQMNQIFLKENMDKLLYDAAAKVNSSYIFISLMRTYSVLCPGAQVQTLFDQMEIKSELKLPKEFYELRQEMCAQYQ